jgi:squalene-associated FAD-dependent desaturase
VTLRVAIVGAGWAGLAAAVSAVQRGHAVTVFESARTPGGRARSVPVPLPEGGTALLDNGQHILIGAYTETLRLMETVGVDLHAALLRLPLVLQDPAGHGIALPSWPAPWDAFGGILAARGWRWHDKISMLRASLRWQLAGFRCAPELTVAQLTAALTPRVRQELIEPLCVSALNTPADRASAQVFLRVLRDALFGRGHGEWGGSNLLLPRQDLGRLLPHAAVDWLQRNGAEVRIGERVQALGNVEAFDDVVLAVPSLEAARLVDEAGIAPSWAESARALRFEAITTVYATGGSRLARPMVALHSGPGAPAQFVFDRGQLGGPPGLLAFVVSASPREREQVAAEVVAQAAALGWHVQPVQVVVEKRATFACEPKLHRPPLAIAPGLWACGDYVEGPYPATLEGAVRSGLAVASRLAHVSA